MHEHNEHKHTLVLCEKCNTVYCSECGMEWKHDMGRITYTTYPEPEHIAVPPTTAPYTYIYPYTTCFHGVVSIF